MKKNLSIFLELLRFLSALGVVFGHARSMVIPWLPAWLSSPTECVAVFFVLSGFVIRYVTVQKETTWLAYAKARVARIVPVAIFALLFTIVLDHIGELHHYTFYTSFPWFNPHSTFADLASCLTFTSELWTQHRVVGSDEPFWSVAFEVSYYIFFALLIYSSPRWRWPLVALWALVVGPKILLSLPIWLMGVACYEFLSRRRDNSASSRRLGVLSLLSGVSLLWLLRFVLMKGAPGPYHWDTFRHIRWTFLYMTGLGIGISLVIVGFGLALGEGSLWPSWFEKRIRWLAGGTFTLYLLHIPILLFLDALFPQSSQSPLFGLSILLADIVACYLLAELVERRKKTISRALTLLIAKTGLAESPVVAPQRGHLVSDPPAA